LSTFAVLGSPAVDVNSAPLFDGLPIRLLRNEAVEMDFGHGCNIAILGIECTRDIRNDAARLLSVPTPSPADSYRVLLYHSPDLAPVAPEAQVDLYLCGHTHGGQVRLPFFGAVATSSAFGKRYEMGLYQNGRMRLYVSRGVGLEGMGAPRVRFLCPPEITLITLTPKEPKPLAA
jgi:predicted MPP superfamily phosphohydrolase